MEKQKNIKKNLLLLVGLFSIFLFISLISATTTLVAPASSSTAVGGSVFWNASFTDFANALNCSLYASSSLTANSSAIVIATATNESVNADYIKGTFNSILLEDANNYVFYAICINETEDSETSASTTGITIDNTVPTAPTSLSPSAGSTEDDSSITFSGTVTGSRTTSCTLNFVGINPGSSSYTMAHSANSCSHSLTNVPEQTYEYYITASDETNTTNSAQTRFNMDIDTPSNWMFQEESIPNETLTMAPGEEGGKFPVWIIVLIVILIIGFVIYKRNN